jgi:membrane protein implicated in regulation of membrane protease activity
MPFSLQTISLPFSLQTIYLGAAVIGGALLLIQIVLSLFGGDADGDVDFDGDVELDHGDIGGHLSFRTVVAFVTFFGIAGMACSRAGLSTSVSLIVAVVVGSLAFWLVGLAMVQLSRLRSQGNVDIRNAVGVEGKVYLSVPGAQEGTGSVTVPIQGRSMQFKAITRGPEIPTGRLCKVVGVHGGDTLEVEAP